MKEGIDLEYKALRDEILVLYRRIQLNNKLYFTITFVTIGYIWETDSPRFLFAIPIISFFFGVQCLHDYQGMQKIGNYISEVIESEVEGLNWETYVRKRRKRESLLFRIISGLSYEFGIYCFFPTLCLLTLIKTENIYEIWEQFLLIIDVILIIGLFSYIFYSKLYNLYFKYPKQGKKKKKKIKSNTSP